MKARDTILHTIFGTAAVIIVARLMIFGILLVVGLSGSKFVYGLYAMVVMLLTACSFIAYTAEFRAYARTKPAPLVGTKWVRWLVYGACIIAHIWCSKFIIAACLSVLVFNIESAWTSAKKG